MSLYRPYDYWRFWRSDLKHIDLHTQESFDYASTYHLRGPIVLCIAPMYQIKKRMRLRLTQEVEVASHQSGSHWAELLALSPRAQLRKYRSTTQNSARYERQINPIFYPCHSSCYSAAVTILNRV